MEPYVRIRPDAALIAARVASEEAPPSSVGQGLQVAAVASLAGLRDSRGNVPLDSWVLVRTGSGVPAAVSERAASVLLEVDGVLSIQEIATRTNLSLPDAVGASLVLLGLGVVDAAPEPAPAVLPAACATMLPAPMDESEEGPASTSGTYALARPRETLRPLALPVVGDWSCEDESERADTCVSDLIGNLALLSDESSIPSVRGVVEWADLAPSEAWLVSLVPSRMTVAAIMRTSPLGDEATLRVLAGLISARVIKLVA